MLLKRNTVSSDKDSEPLTLCGTVSLPGDTQTQLPASAIHKWVNKYTLKPKFKWQLWTVRKGMVEDSLVEARLHFELN